jgi:hypothetical protein
MMVLVLEPTALYSLHAFFTSTNASQTEKTRMVDTAGRTPSIMPVRKEVSGKLRKVSMDTQPASDIIEMEWVFSSSLQMRAGP